METVAILCLLSMCFCTTIGLIDCIFYDHAPYPERNKWYYKKLIGGGIVAYFRYKVRKPPDTHPVEDVN